MGISMIIGGKTLFKKSYAKNFDLADSSVFSEENFENTDIGIYGTL
jgi:hypothetical protein